MLDFLRICKRYPKRNEVEIYPDFEMLTPSNKPIKDLMIKGNAFYAIWDEETNLWSTDPFRAIALIDCELAKYVEEHKNDDSDCLVRISYLKYSSTGSIDKWNRFLKTQCPDNWHTLDSKLIFSNNDTKRSDYASKKLPYPLEQIETPFYNDLMSVLYSPEELHKIEWAIGSIVNGDSKKIQKFEVLYGSAGTGKGTVLDIISELFKGYCCTFEAKALGSANSQFALEPLKDNPLVAIQFDGDLSKIEDNTRLNQLVSHEAMPVNTKNKSIYTNAFHCFLFMGTNKPVKITDAKSGLIRRLIDVSPTGDKVPTTQYNKAMEAIKNFELPGIAWHCREVYEEDPHYYQGYIPVNMLGASNDFYNFVEDSYDVFKTEDSTTLKAAWERYKAYCDDAKVSFPYNKRAFKEELKNYFDNFEERVKIDGISVYSYYSGFKFHLGGETEKKELKKLAKSGEWLNLTSTESLFDIYCKDYPAQYSNSDGIPSHKWVNCTTKLADLNTKREHYVKLPEKIITIDFDYKDKNGNKDQQKNLEEASKWPPTYAEFSKSGAGVHLHYLYSGDVSKLASRFNEDIEIKVSSGNSSLRRRLSFCNNLPIAEIKSGLPLKKGDKVLDLDGSIKNERDIIRRVTRIINGECENVPGTYSGVCLIKKILDESYESGITYDVNKVLRPAVLEYGGNSTNHAQECVKMVGQMKFRSKDILDDEKELYEKPPEPEDPTLIFFDCEVFPNLFLINYKRQGTGEPIIRLINPKPKVVEELMRHKLIGFNCRRYDNHMLWARMMGYSEADLFRLSQRIISGDRDAFIHDAYNVSYTDIYDYASKKQSLKKWEIELKIRHMELGLPWDQPVPEELWDRVSEYCDNDVISTEAVWNATQGDFLAREILADLADGTVNDTTNTLTTRLIFGTNKNPQSSFNYRFLGEKPKGPCFTWKDVMPYAKGETDTKPKGMVWFDGYEFKDGVSTYRGYEVGEGGRVYANPGMYGYSKTYDVASMHPHSIKAEKLFGEYTDIFEDLINVRINIKHKDFEAASKLFNGRLGKYLTDPTMAKNLAQALKIAINSVYGLTSAKFMNAFRDPRNVDNIVAKRGALFMVDLQLAVESLGYTVIHEKTDSIKIHEPDEFIENFVMKFGECYGYSFEVEDVWDRICLVNDAVFVGHTDEGWKATGAEFQHPYIFKTLFTYEPIEFDDLCETKSVSKGAIYMDMEDGNEMRFIGRVGQFCPVKHGGKLYRVDGEKKSAVTGTKDYLWMESEMVKNLGKEDDIDISYYEDIAHDAMWDIIALGDYSSFVNTEKPFVKEDAPVSKEAEVPLELPFK